MSAWDYFVGVIEDINEGDLCFCGGEFCVDLEKIVEKGLRIHAHELAESIRALRNDCKYDMDSVQYRQMTDAASWIDPEVA